MQDVKQRRSSSISRKRGDLVIEDMDKSLAEKKTALVELIASIKPLIEAVNHTSNSKVQALLQLDDFQETVLENLEKLDTGLKEGNDIFHSKLLKNFGKGLFESVLQ